MYKPNLFKYRDVNFMESLKTKDMSAKYSNMLRNLLKPEKNTDLEVD